MFSYLLCQESFFSIVSSNWETSELLSVFREDSVPVPIDFALISPHTNCNEIRSVQPDEIEFEHVLFPFFFNVNLNLQLITVLFNQMCNWTNLIPFRMVLFISAIN